MSSSLRLSLSLLLVSACASNAQMGAGGGAGVSGAGAGGGESVGGSGAGKGGHANTGGTTNTGGAIHTGGTTNTGGAAHTGGATNSGGTNSGGTNSGGTNNSGGTSTGGTNSGGTSNSGGSGNAGGAPQIRPCSGLSGTTPGQWEEITPSRGSIWPMSSTIDSTGTLWVGAYGTAGPNPGHGGLFKSTDCGATWIHTNTGANANEIDRADMWSLAVDLDSGAGQPNVYAIGMYGPDGLWKSTNGGTDWTQLFPAGDLVAHVVPAGPGNPPIAAIASVVLDPTDHLHVIAGVHSTCADPYGPICDLESFDGGANWKIVHVPVAGATGWQEQTGPYIIGGKKWLHATLAGGIWLTTDDGTTWANVAPAGVAGATGGEYTMHPFRATTSGNYFLPSNNPSGLLRSTDAGSHWTAVSGVPRSGNYYVAFAAAGGELFIGDGYAQTLLHAKESTPSQWSNMPLPPPIKSGSGWGVWYLDYDPTNHLLYALVQNPWQWSGLFRTVVQ